MSAPGDGLEARDLRIGYGGQPVLAGITLPALRPGTVTALIGPNAAGKSTLLRGLAGLQRMQGAVWLNGIDLARQPASVRARQLVYLPQALPARSRLAVFEAVLAAAMAGRAGPGWLGRPADAGALDAVEAVLAQLGLAGLSDRCIDALSGGQRQLVGLAQALVRQPAALLLDEPTSALDLYHQCQVIDTIVRETQRRQLVTLVVLHDINLALSCADQVLVLHRGRLAAAGVPSEVIDSDLLASVYRVRGTLQTVRGRAVVTIDGAVPANDPEGTW